MKCKLFLGAISLSSLLLFSGCFEKKEEKKQPMGPIPVATFEVEKKDIPLSFEYPAQLKSLQSVDIFARVEGTLLEQKFVEGGVVKKGQKLFKIDPAKYQANVNNARAQLLLAKASYNEAYQTWERAKKLFAQKALSPKEHDEAQAKYESAKASVSQARAQLDNTLIDLGYTDVIATASGKIGMKKYDIGDLVGGIGQNNVLTTITQFHPIHAEFSIPSNDYFFIRTLNKDNVKVTYILSDGLAYQKSGKMDFIDSVIDKNTSTIKARAIIDNQDDFLIPGEFSRIKAEGFVLKDSIGIPQIALLQGPKGTMVYKIVDGKATPTPVELGHAYGRNIIIKSGLNPGDIIITNQLIKIRPGAPVTPMKQAPANK